MFSNLPGNVYNKCFSLSSTSLFLLCLQSKLFDLNKTYYFYLYCMCTYNLRWPSSELVLDNSLSSGFKSSFSLLLDTSAIDLPGGAEQTGTTDRIRTGGAVNKEVGDMPSLSEVGMPRLRGTPVLNLEATARGTSGCRGLDPGGEVGAIVLTMEDETARDLKLLLKLACKCPLGTEVSILDEFCSSILAGLCIDPMFL